MLSTIITKNYILFFFYRFPEILIFPFPEYLSVYYPPVSVEKDQFQNLYVKKGDGIVVPCLMKDLGFPKVSKRFVFENLWKCWKPTGQVCCMAEGWDTDEEWVRPGVSDTKCRGWVGQKLHLYPFQYCKLYVIQIRYCDTCYYALAPPVYSLSILWV